MRNNRADFDYPNITGILLLEKYKALFICVICFTFLSCSAKKQAISLEVVPMMNGNPINCDNLKMDGKQWRIENLAFFLSNVQINTKEKSTVPVRGEQTSVSLVRVAPKSCTSSIKLSSDVALQPGDKLSLELGVPFALNHLNPVTQPAPMNEPDMFWTWRNGYKFFRLDMRSANDSWAYHLGSVGCVSDSAVRAPQKTCAKPNLSHHTVTVPEGESFSLVLHLEVLLKDIYPTKTNRCVMHGEKEPACPLLYANVSGGSGPLFSLEAR